MALYLLHRSLDTDRNSSGIHAALVDAADEPTARQIAREYTPTGETKVRDSWAAVQVATTGSLPANPLYFEGDCATLLGRCRGT